MDLSALTAGEALTALEARQISAAEYVSALLDRCRRLQSLNAFIHFDPEAALAAARRSDERRAAGKAGALEGLPVVLKDNIDTAAMPTTGGTPALRGNRPKHDAPVAAKLIGAGAVVLGKTNLHELAYGISNNNAAFGPARNPYDPTRIPGASSGGTGVAVGARMAPAGLGSDTGGSVRIPAALCGIAGLRPTLLRWPQAGIVPISHTRDTAGPMARSVADLALLDGIVTGAATDETPADLKGLRLGVPRGHFFENLHPDTAALTEAALKRLAEVGVVLVEADIADVGALDGAAGFPIALYETIVDLNRYLAEHETGLDFAAVVAQVASPDVKGILSSLLGEMAVPEVAYREALTVHRPKLQAAYANYFRTQRVDAVLFPTTPLPACKIGDDDTTMLNGVSVPTFPTFIRNTGPGSVAGIPGLSLPIGLTSTGLPVGLELDSPAGTDRRLLAIGLAIESILPKLPPPQLS
ncbi:MAG: indoleacetamide hydrolase [Rhodospirillaceae bacterium]|nr:indoleacetamide hydrolase [Rhodospirillaceae bacterium]